MPLYRYKALNARGELLDGQMEAATAGEVAVRLQEQGHLPVETRLASEGGGESTWRLLFKPKPFAGERLVQFTQQLATLHTNNAAGGITRLLDMGVEDYLLTSTCLLYTSPSPRDGLLSRMPSSA